MNWALLGNSLLVALGAATLSLCLGAVVAVASVSIRRLGRVLFVGGLVALALPSFQVVNSWMHLFGLAGIARGWAPFELYSVWGAILILASMFWPISFLCLRQGLAGMPQEWLEGEPKLSGAACLRHAAWPAIRGFVPTAWLLPLALALNQFAVPALLQIKTYPAEAWIRFSRDFALVEAFWACLPLMAGPLLALVALRWFPKATPMSMTSHRNAEAPLAHRLSGRWRVPFGVAATLIVAVSAGLPLAQILGSSRTWVELFPALEASRGALATSALLAAVATGLVLLVGGWPRRAWALPWALGLFLLPGTLVGMATLQLFNRPGVSWVLESGFAAVLALTLRLLLVGVLGFMALRLAIPRAAQDTFRLWGGGRVAEWRFLVWPLGRVHLLALAAVTFTLALWEVESLILLVPPGWETLSLRVFNMLHYGHAGQVDALCLWMLLLASLPWIATGLARHLRPSRSWLALVCLPLLFAGGCSPRMPESLGNAKKVESQLFDRVTLIGTRGTGAGQFNKPRSVAVDQRGDIYAVDLTGRVQKFSPDGAYLLGWQMERTEIGRPKGMALAPDGRIVVVEPHYSRLNYFDTSGNAMGWFGQHGKDPGMLMFPRAAAVADDGSIYLSEYGLVERVQCFGPDGKSFIRSFGSPGTGPGEFNRPEGLGLDSEGRLYVADSCNHRVQIFSPDGKFLSAFGKPGTAPGELSYPYDVRVDGEGYRFVCEFGNSRVQVFDRENQPVEMLGWTGLDSSGFASPWAIALDHEGNLIVADSMNHRLQKFWRRRPLSKELVATRASATEDRNR